MVYGYTRDGQLILRTYYASSAVCDLADLGQAPSLGVLLGRRGERPGMRELLPVILSDAVAAWQQESFDRSPSPKLRSGRAAWRAWLSLLDDWEGLASIHDPARLLGHHVWNYRHLVEARRAASIFLGRYADVLSASEKALLGASREYQHLAELLGALLSSDDPSTRGLYDLRNALATAARGGLPLDKWTTDVRERTARVMQWAFELEDKAISLLEVALRLCGG